MLLEKAYLYCSAPKAEMLCRAFEMGHDVMSPERLERQEVDEERTMGWLHCETTSGVEIT